METTLAQRCKAKHSIITIIILSIFIFAPIGVAIYYYFDEDNNPAISITILVLLSLISIFCLISLPLVASIIIKNNKLLDKPLIIYNNDLDNFKFYSVSKKNKEVVVKNGNIIALSLIGSNKYKQVILRYLDENNSEQRALIGYILIPNISLLKDGLNKYHNKQISM